MDRVCNRGASADGIQKPDSRYQTSVVKPIFQSGKGLQLEMESRTGGTGFAVGGKGLERREI